MDADTAAVGIAEVVDENMTNAARVHAVENGKDLAGFSMVAFGGGAPLHATRLMDKLGLDELIVPPGAGVGSAIGFLRAPFAYEAVRSLYTRTDRLRLSTRSNTRAGRADRRGRDVRPPGHRCRTSSIERQVSMRYKGQGWEIPVRLERRRRSTNSPPRPLGGVFTKAYEEFFGRAIDDLAIEAVSWSVRVASVERPPEQCCSCSPALEHRSLPPSYRDLYDPVGGRIVDAAVVERDDLNRRRRASTGRPSSSSRKPPPSSASHHRAVMQSDGTLLDHPRPDTDRRGARA